MWNKNKKKELENYMDKLITDLTDQPKVRLAYDGGDVDKNWLQELPVGAIFTARDKQGRGHPILEFEIMFKYTNGDVLLVNDMNDPNIKIIVPSLEFSRAMDCRCVVTDHG